MPSVPGILALWDNPVFHRFRRSQLRFRASLVWLLATLMITTFIVSLSYIIQTNLGMMPQQAAANQWLPVLVIQGLILLLKGTGRTSAGLIQDKIEQTLDYQRLTPVSPMRSVVGYLFGLPLLEYAMFALTLPHLAFVVIKGEIPMTTLLSVYIVFFTCTIFYHMTAIAVAMVMKRWVWGYLLSVFSVAFLNSILPLAGTQLGLKFLQYLSVFPIIGQKVLPLRLPTARFLMEQRPGQFGFGVPPGAQFQPPPQFRPPPVDPEVITFANSVPFFHWTLSPFAFTLLLQTGLIVTFTTMAVRRWQKATKHSLSKFYSLGLLSVFVLLFLGNLWPVITGEYLPFRIFGVGNLEAIKDEIAIALPLMFAMSVLLMCVFLYFVFVPSHHAYIRGVRRAGKLGRKAARPWDDDSASIPFMGISIVIALIGFWVLLSQMMSAGYTDTFEASDFHAIWRLPLALALGLICVLLLLQVLEVRGTILTLLLIWLLPVLIAIVSVAAMERMTSVHAVLAAVSPVALIVMSGLLPLDASISFDPNETFEAMHTGTQAGFAFVSLQIALLGYRWLQLRRTLR